MTAAIIKAQRPVLWKVTEGGKDCPRGCYKLELVMHFQSCLLFHVLLCRVVKGIEPNPNPHFWKNQTEPEPSFYKLDKEPNWTLVVIEPAPNPNNEGSFPYLELHLSPLKLDLLARQDSCCMVSATTPVPRCSATWLCNAGRSRLYAEVAPSCHFDVHWK